jgi:predicted Zn-dependent protease with MMP-like domain
VVRASLEEVPQALRSYLENVVVEALDYPRTPPVEAGTDPFLLGLYVGVPRTERTQEVRDHLDRIFIFKRNLEIEFPSRADLREEIRKTVIHEIAHHFGLGEEDMGEYA